MNTHYSETTAGPLTARSEAFGIQTEAIDGQDVRIVHRVAVKSVDKARRGDGPSFILCNTYRFHGHHVGDVDRAYYRSKQEEEEWKGQRDPIQILAHWLVRNKLTDSSSLTRIQSAIAADIKRAVSEALESPYPELEEVRQDVYA